MKKILLLIASLFIMNIYHYSVFADELDLVDIFGNEEDDLGVFGENKSDNGSMYMKGTKLDGDLFQLSIFSKDLVEPTLGIAFHLTYEKDKLAFLKYESGDFLERGGDPFYLVKNDISGDKVLFGETLRRNDSFPIGSGLVTNFYFQILEEDNFKFEFSNGSVSTLNTVRQDLDKIDWQDFIFEGVMSTSDFGKNSVLNPSHFSISKFWIVVIILAAAIPTSYLIISLIKRNHKLKKYSQIT